MKQDVKGIGSDAVSRRQESERVGESLSVPRGPDGVLEQQIRHPPSAEDPV